MQSHSLPERFRLDRTRQTRGDVFGGQGMVTRHGELGALKPWQGGPGVPTQCSAAGKAPRDRQYSHAESALMAPMHEVAPKTYNQHTQKVMNVGVLILVVQ